MNSLNDDLKFSPAGRAVLKDEEKLRLKPYDDGAGFGTVGWGHKILPGEDFSEGITAEQADEILEADIAIAESIVRRLVKVRLTQGQFDCLVDFTFNEGGKQLAESHLLLLLNSGLYGSVPMQLFRTQPDGPHGFIFAGGQVMNGLIVRRQREIELWNS